MSAMNHHSSSSLAASSPSMEGETIQLPAAEVATSPVNDMASLTAKLRDSDGVILRSSSSSSFETHPFIAESTQSYHSSPNPNSSPSSTPIDPTIMKLLVNGNLNEILELEPKLWELKCPRDRNSVLHIAATNSSEARLISDIVPISRDVIKWKNSDEDLAFHSAAKAGRLDCLKALTDWTKYDPEEREIDAKLLGWANKDEDTPLHIALKKNHLEMADYLVNEYGKACYALNKKMVSPIYLGIQAGYSDLVKKMLQLAKANVPDAENALFRGKSVVHAAIEAGKIDILSEILKNFRNLIESYDEEERTPLSYAAFKGYLEGVQYLLKEFPDSAYKCDKDDEGSFPIHKAASGGHVKVIKALHCTKHLCNRKGQNILHVAAGSGKFKAVSYLLNIPELERLINLKDDDDNTPLHLAALGFHPRVVYILTRERRINLELKNKNGLTALDVAEIHSGSNPMFEKRLTWMALRYIDAPRSSQSTRKSYTKKKIQEEKKHHKTRQRKQKKKQLESYNDRIGTFLLVATLVATVTFAAGFTLPGGFKQDEPQIGMTVLPHKWAFQVFVICNTAAMYSSILAVVILIWAHLGDLKLILVSLKFALPLLGLALAMMSVAFMMGAYVVLRNQLWLSYVVLVLGSVFLVVMLLFFIPLYNPSYIRNPVVRFFFSGTLLLLVLVCEKGHYDYA